MNLRENKAIERQRLMKKTTIMMALMLAAVVCRGDEAPVQDKAAEAAEAKAKMEARAQRAVKSAVSLFSQNEDERAVNMLEAVGRMYPDSVARFTANLELGRHFLDKRNFERATTELRLAQRSPLPEVQAESLLLQGQVQNSRGNPGEAMMTLRCLTQDYPTSPFANDAYFLIGQIHFEAHRWTRAAEAFEMVGTAVPVQATNEEVLVEAGQRVFVHVKDKDLTIMHQLGEKYDVMLETKNGDREKATLIPFGKGDGDFIASTYTSANPSKPMDGTLTVRGQEEISVTYIDKNTEDGVQNRKLNANAKVVSTGSIAFMDGAMRQRVRGVFSGQPAIIRLSDLDLDTTAHSDKAKVTIRVQYRERPAPLPGADPNDPPPPPAPDAPWLTRNEVELELSEVTNRNGVFVGRITPQILGTNETAAAGEVAVQPDDRISVVYRDQLYLDGKKPTDRSCEAMILVGGSSEPQSIMAHASDPMVQARKLLLEAQLLYKWGTIFKDVGLESHAIAKAEDGLEHVDELFELMKKSSLERETVESAYEARWNLLLIENKLDQAIQTCRALVKKYPDTVLADRAFMQIANANRAKDTEEGRNNAILVYNSILQMENSPLKPEAQFRIGEILEEIARIKVEGKKGQKPDFSPAMVAFKRCADSYPNSSYAGESIKRVIDYYISIRDYGRAQETLERVFQDYPDAPWLDEMLLKWGVVCHRLGNREEALAKFRRLIEEYPSGASAKQAMNFIKKLEQQKEQGE